MSLKMKVIFEHLIEAAKTNQKITYQLSVKRQIFLVCLFYCFFRLQIYIAVTAILSQSVIYVVFL